VRQVQVHRYGGPEVLQIMEVEMPVISSAEVLVQVKYASANPKDILLRKGKLKPYMSISFPLKLGQDFSGVVVEVGKNAGPFRPGDRVYGMVNQHNNGTWSEYVAVTPNEIWYAPENLGFAEAAAVPLAAQTALQALQTIAKIKPGQRACINGASGGVGTFAVQIAKILGAQVTAISSEKNHALLRSLGADEVVDYKATPPGSMQGHFDVFLDVFGNQNRPKVKHLLGRHGWYITTVPSLRSLRDTVFSLLKMGKSRLVVVESYSEDLQLLKNWVEEGKLKVIIEAEFPLPRVAEVHQRIETKRTVGKIVVKVG
jgi:NADPH:quinone reductase-like Zn-dependent oxidoreductase